MHGDELKAWLDAVQCGDEVAVCHNYGRDFYIQKIDKVHKLHFVIGPTKYRRETGHSIGERGFGGGSFITAPTAEIRDKVLRAKLLHKLHQLIREADSTNGLSTDVLSEMVRVATAALASSGGT